MKKVIDGLPVMVNRKRIKNMYLYVKPPDGHLEISAPVRMPDARITEFVRTRKEWILKNQEKIASRNPVREPGFDEGEIHYLWGKPHKLRIVHGRRNFVKQVGREIIMVLKDPERADTEVRRKMMNEWYRGLLKERITERLPEIEKITGLRCSSWQVKNMKSRWGTCNTVTDKIWLNLQLARKDRICLDYVILHELAHTKVRNHGREFKNLMDLYMPQWREVRKHLNRAA
ncbi:MAG: M48 family metallopeptidase [Clostridia bacterium]|nr:M48 family metallopeptidase [Clostridia bacterium]